MDESTERFARIQFIARRDGSVLKRSEKFMAKKCAVQPCKTIDKVFTSVEAALKAQQDNS